MSYGTSYKPYSYVSGVATVQYLVSRAGWYIRPRTADHGIIVAPAPHFSDDGKEIFFPVYRSHATSAQGWSVDDEQLHRHPGILGTLAAIYGGTPRDMAKEISGIYEGIVGRDDAGNVRFAVCFGLTKPKPPRCLPPLPVVFTMREADERGESVTCYGFARSESDVPSGAAVSYERIIEA